MGVQLQDKMKALLQNGAGVNLFFALKDGDDVVIKRADLASGDTQKNLVRQFISLLEEEFVDVEEVQVRELSETDDRRNVLYHYDFDEFPESLNYFSEFDYKKSYETFSFKEDDLSKLDAYLIVLGSQEQYCVLYKKFYPVFLIGRGSFFLMKAKRRFEEFNEDILRVSRDYQLLMLDEDIYVRDLKVLEKFGGFKAIIEKEAEAAVAEIGNMGLLEEPEILSETLKADVTFARKLGRVRKTSPVLKLNIPNDQVIAFSNTHPGIKGKLKYSENGDKILLTTKKSQDLFIRLLDDSYLTSELTKQYYASLSKENVTEEK